MTLNLSEFNKCSDDFRGLGGFLGLSCAGPEVGLNGPGGSFPTQDVLLFYESQIQNLRLNGDSTWKKENETSECLYNSVVTWADYE